MNREALRLRTFRSFSIFVLGIALFIALWTWATEPFETGTEAPIFRTVLELNGRLWQKLFDPGRSAGEPPAPSVGKSPRINGDLGLRAPLDFKSWRLVVESDHDRVGAHTLELSLDEIKSLPRAYSTVEFKCIEGWTEVISYAGVKFSDFLRHYKLGAKSPGAWEGGQMPKEKFMFVALETPDGEYYVSIDMASMLHPQTMLAYEMNGLPLSEENGAPLRLIIPVKYGIKSLKRIGKIYFSDRRPPDFWAERGYDWFSGL